MKKEQVIQQLLRLDYYKSSDNRQLYELTLSELENEYRAVTGHHIHCGLR
ncbi:Fur-regulated basic protein FbpA [Metabacillus endolithicus]|uniref:Fur-regulated basic protein FbpA n=1 Tax=Metabacillus endolithicus TaxID=1535204 RepID=A0ABW5C4N9_9BACI|nr:Fur-regulated basic protein FbpA [Metabacillus endolithicus]UPG65172.1 Fur-regulated basic protein FbpA [Metabacillus endolithicus]